MADGKKPSASAMSIAEFFKRSFPLLAFGLLFTFTSSFGQTFLLSLYVPSLERFLAISNTALGSVYAAATLASAFTLPWLGGWFDRMDIRRYALLVIGGMSISLLLLSFSYHILAVGVALYGLRLFGQGLMSHTAVAAMARYFTTGRGKAIGLATLGHPAGEALLPLTVTLLIGAIGWRSTLQLSALICIVLSAPLALYLLQQSKVRLRAYAIQTRAKLSLTQLRVSPLSVISERRFWIIAPVMFMLGLTSTIIFFYQLKLGADRGWQPEWVAGSIAVFALSNAFGMSVSGPLVDRLSGRRLFKLFALPYLVGLGILVFYTHPLAYPIALLFLGLSNGAGSTIKNAMMAEVYGIEIIGQVRSLYITVIVVSTGMGPIVFGILLDAGWTYSQALAAVAVTMALSAANAMRELGRDR
jgi:MFS family permease